VNTGGTSRLINVSTRGYVPAGGALTRALSSRATPARRVGDPRHRTDARRFGVSDTLVDPTMEVIPLGTARAVAANDNWEGTDALARGVLASRSVSLCCGDIG
jgi:hypothetical protein